MWIAIAALLLLLWMVGLGLFHVSGNSVHLLAVLAMISFALHVGQWRRRKRVKA